MAQTIGSGICRGRRNQVQIGVDLGGNKIEVALRSPGGKLLFRRRTATPRSYRNVLESLVPPKHDDLGRVRGASSLWFADTRS